MTSLSFASNENNNVSTRTQHKTRRHGGHDLLGGGHDKVGLYCYTDCKIRNVRVYVKTVEEELGLE